MRIYLACTVRGDRSGVEAARAIAARLRLQGHDILTSHLLDDRVEEAEASLSEREVYDRDLRWLDTCDALVAEASGSTYGVGFEVGYVTAKALTSGQRVLVVYAAARRGEVSRLVSGYRAPRGRSVACNGSIAELEAIVDAEFEVAAGT